MKKLLKFIPALLTLSAIFTSCYDPVFENIRREVKLEDGQIAGFINDIVRFKNNDEEYLYLPTGLIYSKKITDSVNKPGDLAVADSHGKWNKTQHGIGEIAYDYYGEKFNGEYVVKFAANSNTLYALTSTLGVYDDKGRNIPTGFKLYYLNNVSENLTAFGNDSQIQKDINNYFATGDKDNYATDLRIQLFCTNTPKNENRRAFLKIGSSGLWFKTLIDGTETEVESLIYELEGTTPKLLYYRTKNTDNFRVLGEYYKSLYYNVLSAVDLGEKKVLFLPFIGVTSNATINNDADWICYGKGTNAYYFTKKIYEENSENIIKYFNNQTDENYKTVESILKSVGLSTDKEIISATACADDILFGSRGNGVFRAKITGSGDSVEIKSETNFEDLNTQDIMQSPYIIRMLFTVDPSKSFKEATRYSAMDFLYTASNSTANDNYRGLWSYYPSRGNWNKE